MDIRSTLQQITIKMHYMGRETSVTSLYLPPSVKINLNDLYLLNRSLLNHKMILGDYNAHHTLWGDKKICPRGRKILKFVESSNLVVLNKDDPTCISPKGIPTCIDVSLVSPHLSLEAEWVTHPDMLGSNHMPICITYPKENNNDAIRPSYVYNVKKANWNTYTITANLSLNNANINNNCENIEKEIIRAA